MDMVTSVESIDKIDSGIIKEQLKRTPRGLKRIASRCVFGCPQVIETEVFIEGNKPFPTLYWLTCPLKIKAISGLEDEGWSERLLGALADDILLRKRFAMAQEDYKMGRRHSAGQRNHSMLETGIGGVRDLNAVKCLHAHYAHYLAGADNPIGEIVDNEIHGLECRQRCGES